MLIPLLSALAVMQSSLDDATKSQTVTALVKAMDDDYFFPNLAREVEAALQQKLTSGAYATCGDGPSFAKQLTEDMRAICHDAHLHVSFSETALPERTKRDQPTDAEVAKMKHMDKVMNAGFEDVKRLAGNVGYIDFRMFADPSSAAAPIRAAMDFVSNTDALIFDIRGNHGGDPETVRLLCSYLFDSKPVHLNDILFEKGKKKTEFWTLKSVPGSRYAGRDVYVLTGPQTGSGAEEFAYDLQNLHRATIVGQSTWGGANPGGFERLNDHFSAFIPVGQAQNPYTKTNWEGVGVQPDVKVKTEDALNEAHRMALRNLLAKATDPDDKDRLQRALDSIK